MSITSYTLSSPERVFGDKNNKRKFHYFPTVKRAPRGAPRLTDDARIKEYVISLNAFPKRDWREYLGAVVRNLLEWQNSSRNSSGISLLQRMILIIVCLRNSRSKMQDLLATCNSISAALLQKPFLPEKHCRDTNQQKGYRKSSL